MDTEKIKRKGAGRQEARCILGLVSLPSTDHIDAFFNELESTLRPLKKEEKKKKVQQTLRNLIDSKLEFGQYANQPLSSIPRDYLHWLSSSMEDTKSRIDQYLELTKDQDDD